MGVFSSEGQIKFISKARVPLYILAASPIILSFIINAHRSVQTRHQISNVEEKNKLDMYLAHHKYHIELFKGRDEKLDLDSGKDLKLKIGNGYHFYSVIFPNNNIMTGVVDITPTVKGYSISDCLMEIYRSFFSADICREIEEGITSKSQSQSQSYRDIFKDLDYSNEQRVFPICIENVLSFLFKFIGMFDITLISEDSGDVNSKLTCDMEVIEKQKIARSILIYWIYINRAILSDFNLQDEECHITAFIDFINVIGIKQKNKLS